MVMSKPDRDLVDQETLRQHEIDDLDLPPAEKVKARDDVRKAFDDALDTGRPPGPAHA
jgi:hypothetical protein